MADSSLIKAVYNPKTFFLHAASLPQAFAHWEIFSTAASRRSGTRISMSLLGNKLSLPLPVIGLVGFYLTNYLIGPRPFLKRLASLLKIKIDFQIMGNYPIFRSAVPRFRVRTKVLLTRSPLSDEPLAGSVGALDLHALSTPPAFILDQDQILIKNKEKKIARNNEEKVDPVK